MFERYTEKARRVIFFGRYEASQYGSSVIDSEHLLLGLLREAKRISLRLGDGAAQAIRSQIEARAPKHEPIPTSIDLPLSGAAKQALKYASEEADRLNHRHIGTEHLFLGLAREKDCLAAELLEPFGAQVEKIRKELETAADPEEPQRQVGRLVSADNFRKSRDSAEIIRLRGQIWNAACIRDAVQRCCEQKWHWRKAAWKPRDLCVNRKTGRISLDASLAADLENFELLKEGLKKDYCAICRWELHESDDDHGVGYTNGRDWICTECYDKFWDRPNFVSGSYSDLT